MLRALNDIQTALRDTLLTKAQGSALTRLSSFYGFRRPLVFSEDSWRAALRSCVYGPRGTLGCTHEFVEAIYRDAVRSYEIVISEADPHTVTFSSGPAGESDFQCEHVNRLVRIRFLPKSALPVDPALFLDDPFDRIPWRSRLFWTSGPAVVGAGSATLDLVPYDSAYFDGCNWGGGPNAIDSAAEPASSVAYLDLLPFFYSEPTPGPDDTLVPGVTDSCVFKLRSDLDQLQPPSSYLLETGGVDRDLVDASMPDQGHMMDELNIFGAIPAPPAAGDQVDGPRPLYLGGERPSAVAALIDLLLVAGVRAEEVRHVFDCP